MYIYEFRVLVCQGRKCYFSSRINVLSDTPTFLKRCVGQKRKNEKGAEAPH